VPAELFKRVNLDYLYAPFLERLLVAIDDCKTAGHLYTATLGYRTYAVQDALYAEGRNAPGAIVTNARGGESAHNFGLAVDFYAGDWDPASYDLLGTMVKLRGLVWGGDWRKPDRPHVQWPSYVTATELTSLRKAYEATHGDDLTKLRAAWRIIP
jgi:peptidoglycan L-alanyl-D-glutamate endopeptidase CwlK